MFQQKLQELKDVIQQVQFSTSQEMQSQQVYINSLQTETQQLHQQKKELLLSQREELTQHYDMLLAQREEIYHTRENEILQQIQALDNRFETLTLENTKIKNLYREKKLQYEQLYEQMIQKDEKVKKLNYDLEDAHSNSMKKEDSSTRRISQLEMERDSWLNEKENLRKEYELKLEQVIRHRKEFLFNVFMLSQ